MLQCGKEITSGQAFWSKSTKAVKHIDCPTRNVNNQAIASTNVEEFVSQESKKKNSLVLNIENLSEQTIELKCFICGNKTISRNEYDICRIP